MCMFYLEITHSSYEKKKKKIFDEIRIQTFSFTLGIVEGIINSKIVIL